MPSGAEKVDKTLADVIGGVGAAHETAIIKLGTGYVVSL